MLENVMQNDDLLSQISYVSALIINARESSPLFLRKRHESLVPRCNRHKCSSFWFFFRAIFDNRTKMKNIMRSFFSMRLDNLAPNFKRVEVQTGKSHKGNRASFVCVHTCIYLTLRICVMFHVYHIRKKG